MSRREPSGGRIVRAIAWMVWAGFLLSLLTYALIASYHTGPRGELSGSILFSFLIAGALCALVSLGLGRFLPKALVRRKKIDPNATGGAIALLAFSLFAWSFAESIGVYGLTLYFLSGRAGVLGAFLVLSALAFVFVSPRAWTVR